MSIEALDFARHKGWRVRPLPDMAHAAGQNHAILGADELALAAADYPIFLLKSAETGRFSIVALFAFEPGRNLFASGDSWHATYLPRNLLRYPFFLVGDENGSGPQLGIDETSGHVGGNEGRLLFDPGGAMSSFASHMADVLEAMRADAVRTDLLIEAMIVHRLLRPVDLVLTFADGRQRQIDGLYSISPTALGELGDPIVLTLHHAGHLAFLHGIMASLAQVNRLQQLHDGQFENRIAKLEIELRN